MKLLRGGMIQHTVSISIVLRISRSILLFTHRNKSKYLAAQTPLAPENRTKLIQAADIFYAKILHAGTDPILLNLRKRRSEPAG